MSIKLHPMPGEALASVLSCQFEVASVVPVARGALGLSVLLEVWRNGRDLCRVALPGAVCHEVLLAILAAKCEPVFCDVDVATGIVPESEWFKARELGAEVAVAVHLYGNPAEVGPIRSIFPAPDCLLIDDAAQALGSRGGTYLAGAGGDVGLLSFGATKQIATANAALLFHRAELAEAFVPRLRSVTPQPESLRSAVTADFRSRLEQARARVRASDGRSAGGFRGLLDGLAPVLRVPFAESAVVATIEALAHFPSAAEERVDKMHAWMAALEGTSLRPVGMSRGCVPWRFACRLPGIAWSEQHEIATSLRASGMHVSNWYLPVQWFVGASSGTLPGTEQLAREVFQFWLDESTSRQSIAQQSVTVKQTFEHHFRHRRSGE